MRLGSGFGLLPRRFFFHRLLDLSEARTNGEKLMASVQSPKRKSKPASKSVSEEQAFLKKRPQLLKRYAGKFVAVYRGRVVGHGRNDEELAGRMYKRFGDAPFYIGKVQAGLPVYELPSPEAFL
jgi:hypothetical protein